MVRSYAKGYAGERELVHTLYKLGWAVMRAPRSGRIGIASPDIVAIKNGKVVVIECKSRMDGFTVPKEQLEELLEWEKRAGATAYIGWKRFRQGWFFLRLNDVLQNNGNVGLRFLDGRALSINDI